MRVSRSFAFIDLSGFTALTARAGDERAVAVLSTFRALVREVCSRRGVRIAKWLGDGAMLVGVETEPVVAALLELQRRAGADASNMAIRSGITVGQVILHEGDDYIGHDVNLAARLCELAEGGEVVGAVAVTAHLPGWATVVGHDQIVVRGLDVPEPVVRLGFAELTSAASPDPICGIPLTVEVADSWTVDALGQPVLFCSPSCADTWQRRPPPPPESQGSPRVPLMGL